MIRSSVIRFCAVIISITSLVGLTQPADANPAVYEVGDDPAVGFNLLSWSNFGASGASTWENAVQGLYDAGFREVSISPVRFVNINTGQILATSPKGPELSHIEAGVVRAKSLGMRVTLNPFVELFIPHGPGTADDVYFAPLPSAGGCTWRGCWNPTAGSAVANQFWTDYQNYMVAVAQIAQTNNVNAMTIGTENKFLDDDTTHNGSWTSVINAVDAVYHGPLGYASNWDDYRNGNLTSTIWDNPKIDFIGIDSYFNTVLYDYFKSQNPGATNAQITTLVNNAVNPIQTYPDQTFIDLMTNAWKKQLEIDSPTITVSDGTTRTYFDYDGILPFAAARKGGGGMPIEFTEIGHLYYNTTAASPQTSAGSVDTAEQRMAFQGLLNALDGRAGIFNAVDIWNWGMAGTGHNNWDWGVAADVSPANAGADANNLPVTQWLRQFVDTAVFPFPGDYNRDGVDDAADYVVWR